MLLWASLLPVIFSVFTSPHPPQDFCDFHTYHSNTLPSLLFQIAPTPCLSSRVFHTLPSLSILFAPTPCSLHFLLVPTPCPSSRCSHTVSSPVSLPLSHLACSGFVNLLKLYHVTFVVFITRIDTLPKLPLLIQFLSVSTAMQILLRQIQWGQGQGPTSPLNFASPSRSGSHPGHDCPTHPWICQSCPCPCHVTHFCTFSNRKEVCEMISERGHRACASY